MQKNSVKFQSESVECTEEMLKMVWTVNGSYRTASSKESIFLFKIYDHNTTINVDFGSEKLSLTSCYTL